MKTKWKARDGEKLSNTIIAVFKYFKLLLKHGVRNK